MSMSSDESSSKENTSHRLNLPSDTSFNPFGKLQTMIECNRMVLSRSVDKLIESFTKDDVDKKKLFLKRRPEATQVLVYLKKVLETLKGLAKVNPIAVTSYLTIYVPSLSKLGNAFLINTENMKSGDTLLICNNVADLLNETAKSSQPPYTSELLQEWSPLFASFFNSSVAILRTSSVNLWKCTFATKIDGKLKYPKNLTRTFILEATKKAGLNVPENEEEDEQDNIVGIHDEEAMDGIEVVQTNKTPIDFAEPLIPSSSSTSKNQESLSSFELSQQPNFDNLAQKLISEKNATHSLPKTPESVKKSRKFAEKALIDEDSCDFVVIKTTPSSSKKNQLTDHQMEKFEESRDGINYVNEESQSGTQKAAAIKNALTTFNFEIEGTSTSTATEKSEEVVEKPTEVSEPRKSVKRQRRSLFCDEKSSDEPKTTRTRSKKMKIDNKVAETTKPASISIKAEIQDSPEEETLPVMEIPEVRISVKKEVEDERSTIIIENPISIKMEPEEEYSSSSSSITSSQEKDKQKRKSRNPKKVEQGTPKRRSMRSLAAKNIEKTPEKSPAKVANSQKSPGKAAKSPKKEQIAELQNSPQKTPEKLPAPQNTPEKMPETPKTERNIPKIATTPSILRKTPVEGTPMTERKRNRVHFDATESSTKNREISQSPQKVGNVEKPPSSSTTITSSISTSTVSSSSSSSNLFDFDVNTTFCPIYPNLKDCEDPIESIIRLLVPFSGVVTAISILRKSFHSAYIRTIGQFAEMSVQQVNKLNGIRIPREKTVRKVLGDYEAKLTKLANMPKIDEISTENVEKEVEVEKVVEMEVENMPKSTENLQEVAENNKENAEIAPEKMDVESERLAEKEEIVEESPKIPEVVEKPEILKKSKVPEVSEVASSQENLPAHKSAEGSLLKEADELDKLVRKISRKLGRGQISATENIAEIDDRIYDSFLVLRGLVKERGFSNV
ncbi:unnamed protein product [Caenorhabditis angaria]|uniref:Uncharacterized protein n=1 Tax=Caenorhabditis angaria TaxID=860376 RepID=A0A9P1IQ62_9PELO|nr:unnamed protein product [Caenorhabditis angaria]